MGMYEEQEAAHQLQSERQSGSPAPIPNPQAKVKPPTSLTASPLGHNVFTVVYFMPNGEAEIRYERETGAGIGSSNLASRSFLVLKVNPSVNGAPPSVEILKSTLNPSDLMREVVTGFLKTEDPDDPSTHEIDCTCIMCIPGS